MIRRLTALATAALFFLLAPIASSAVASAATPAPAWLDPSAGWHGQAIERPSLTPPTERVSAAIRAVGVVRAGAGFGRPSGSAAVRRVQRLLHGLGYATGPIDGRFGPRTRSAVGWFQHKHGLAVDGVVGPATLSHLNRRARQGGRPAETGGRDTPASRPAPQRQPRDEGGRGDRAQALPAATPQPRSEGDTASPGDTWLVAALAVLAILGAILAAVLLRRRRRARPEEGTVISLTEPPWVVGRSADPAIGEFAGMATALHVSPPMSGSSSAAAVRYCVIDDRRRIPFWVAADEITESRKPNGSEHRVPEDLPYTDLAGARPASGRFSRPGARPRRRGTLGRRVPGSEQPVGGRISWLRSLGMPPESIADLLNDQRVPPPPGVAAWSAATVVEAAGHREERPPAGGRRR